MPLVLTFAMSHVCREVMEMTVRFMDSNFRRDGVPPTLEDFAAMARRAYDSLPDEFRALTGDVIIEITDWPTAEVLQEMQAQSRYEILGLFQGVGRVQAGATPWTGQMPNMVWLYREPILDYWHAHNDRLEDIIAHVLIHEIGHHFGLSDEDMERVESGETL